MVILHQKFELGLRLHWILNFSSRIEKWRNYLLKNVRRMSVLHNYPKHKPKLQMFYFRLIPSETIVETIRSKNIYKEFANTLREQCLNFNFVWNNSFCDAVDLEECYKYLQNNIPESCGNCFSKVFLTHTINRRLWLFSKLHVIMLTIIRWKHHCMLVLGKQYLKLADRNN